MNPKPSNTNISEPLAQVGAVLYYDSELDTPALPDYKQGGKHWKLAGSCVLVSPTQILTIGHILGGHGESAAALRKYYSIFFPYAGFFTLSQKNPLQWETKQTLGDNLALATLSEPITAWPPIPPLKIEGRLKYKDQATVYGYGSWPESEFGSIEGLQQQLLVELGPPNVPRWREKPGWKHYDNLDVSWSSWENGKKTIGRGNSGGPFLWSKNGSPSVIGITREVNKDQQVGSWISRDRRRWLKEAPLSQNATVSPAADWKAWQLLSLDADGYQVIPFAVPPGATRVQATLNASQGMRLQMDIVPANQTASLIARLKADDEASGQFLARKLDVTSEVKEFAVGVCPVTAAPKRAKGVLAQLCVLFT